MGKIVTIKIVSDNVKEYLQFGWQHTENVQRRLGPHHYTKYVLARDNDTLNFNQIVSPKKEQKTKLKSVDINLL